VAALAQNLQLLCFHEQTLDEGVPIYEPLLGINYGVLVVNLHPLLREVLAALSTAVVFRYATRLRVQPGLSECVPKNVIPRWPAAEGSSQC
jgi:hypothetical protein